MDWKKLENVKWKIKLKKLVFDFEDIYFFIALEKKN